MNLLDKKMTLKQFIYRIAVFQDRYFRLDEFLKRPGITAREVEQIYKDKSNIAIQLANFILDRNMSVEILNNELLSNGE